MPFTWRTVYSAGLRQDKRDGLGTCCARCCENIGLAKEYPIPRIPIGQGGRRDTDNCVILCAKCIDEVGGLDHPDEIPYSGLPCFRV